LTRTSGVFAISAMLAVGACCARATAGWISAADKAMTFRDLTTTDTKFSPRTEFAPVRAHLLRSM
jgi:hypothetical protein